MSACEIHKIKPSSLIKLTNEEIIKIHSSKVDISSEEIFNEFQKNLEKRRIGKVKVILLTRKNLLKEDSKFIERFMITVKFF